MSRIPPSGLWAVRDCRVLSEHAKIAYFILWTRQPDIRPSNQTLADDMGVSKSTAKAAVRELEAAGLLRRVPRLTVKGDSDANIYVLAQVPEGWGVTRPTPVAERPTGGASPDPKDSNQKPGSEGRKSQASRRARPAVAREYPDPQKVAFTREAVAEVYGSDEEQEMSDGQAWQLWDRLVGDRSPKRPVAYLTKIFEETPYLDTHLAMCDPDWDPWAA